MLYSKIAYLKVKEGVRRLCFLEIILLLFYSMQLIAGSGDQNQNQNQNKYLNDVFPLFLGDNHYDYSNGLSKEIQSPILYNNNKFLNFEENIRKANFSSPNYFHITLDNSILDISADTLRSRLSDGSFLGITGKNVIVAVIDSGIDFKHPDFINPDGSTRIRYLWDPSDPSFATLGMGAPPPDGGIGTVYESGHINAALRGWGTISSNDVCGHGTHVTGIATGNGAAGNSELPSGQFVGVAPESDIIVVKVFDDACEYLYQSVNLVQALEFVNEKASILGKPYVVNLSLGSQIGGHDGNDLEEIAIDKISGAGKPGRAVVVSAGNDGGNPIHVSGLLRDSNEIYIGVSQAEPDQAVFDFWFSVFDELSVFLEGGGKPKEDITNQIMLRPYTADKRLIFVTDRAPRFSIVLVGKNITSGSFDGWLSGNARFMDHVDFSRLVSIPGTARNSITIAAHTTKNQWIDVSGHSWIIPRAFLDAPADFTSPGPTRDGRQKPELSAPGQVIASSLSDMAGELLFPNKTVLMDSQHAIARGTSMSAPHVSGIIALLFEKNPSLDSSLIREILISSTRKDSYTHPEPNNVTGYGKADAVQALKPEMPRVVISADKSQLRVGDNLTVYYSLESGEEPIYVEGWVAMQDPSGRFFYLNPEDGVFKDSPQPYIQSVKFDGQTGPLFSVKADSDTTPGIYNFYAVGILPGGDPFNPSYWLTNLAQTKVQLRP